MDKGEETWSTEFHKRLRRARSEHNLAVSEREAWEPEQTVVHNESAVIAHYKQELRCVKAQFRELSIKAARYEERLKYEGKEVEESRRKRLEEQLAQAEENRQKKDAHIADLTDEIGRINKEKVSAEQELEEQLAQAEENRQKKDAHIADLTDEIGRINKEKVSAEQELEQQRSETERQSLELQRLRNFIESQALEHQKVLKQMEELKEMQMEKENKLEHVEKTQRKLKEDKKQLKETIAALVAKETEMTVSKAKKGLFGRTKAEKTDMTGAEAKKAEEIVLQRKIQEIEEAMATMGKEKERIKDDYRQRFAGLEEELKEYVKKKELQELLGKTKFDSSMPCNLYDEEILNKIRTLFVSNIIPMNILHIFHMYNTNVLVQQDIDVVSAVTSHYGKGTGAAELLSYLVRYKDWFSCLIQVLRHPLVKQGHVADAMWQALGMGKTRDNTDSLDDVREKIKIAVKTLRPMKVVWSEDAIHCLKFILQTCWDYPNFSTDVGDLLSELSYSGTCMKILGEKLTETGLGDDNIWPVIDNTLSTCWNYSAASTKFTKRLEESGAVHLMSNILRQQHYLDHLDRQRETHVVKASISVLYNIAVDVGNIDAFKDSKTVEVLMSLTKSSNENIKVWAIAALVFIVEEMDRDKLTVTSDLIDTLVQGIHKAVDNTTDRKYVGFTAGTLTQCLATLAVADSNKEKIVKANTLDLCLTLLTNTHPDSAEQLWSAECLYQLAHKGHIREEIQEFPHLVSTMEQLKDRDDSNVRQSVRRALCKIKGEKKELLDEIKEDIKTAARRLEQMTDYHSKDVIKSLRVICHTYIDYPSYSTDIGDLLCYFSCPETCMNILKEKLTVTNLNNDNIWPVIYLAHTACWNFSFCSHKFAKRLAELEAVKFMTNILKEKAYLDNLDRVRERRVVEGAVNILQHIAIHVGKIPEFRDHNTVEVLMPLTVSRVSDIGADAMVALAWLVEEEEKDKLTDQTDIITTILGWLRQALDNKEDRTSYGVTATLHTECLTRLAVVDTNKRKIVEAEGLHLFCKMLRDTVTSEHDQTAQCLAIMATDTSIRQEIQRFPDLVQALEDLQASDDADVRKSVATALSRIKGQV